MITSGQKTSLLVPYQLPEFIRDNPDYSNFVLFLQAYYEWLEETGNVTDRSKNLLNYKDVDATTDEFVQYFYNDFLQYFPTEILADKNEVLKVAKQMYQAKGTPASFQFFFRTLYNTDVDFFYTKDAVLKASAGKWYVSKSLKLSTADLNFLNTNNLRIFGETTKSIATIENSVLSQNKIEVFISNIERLFQSGEYVRVVDNFNQDVLFNGQPLRAKIVGQISQIKINPNLRGQNYRGANTQLQYPGDPVVVYGGLTDPILGHGASATVGTAEKGSIKNIQVANTIISNTRVLVGGFGYTPEDSTQSAYSIINIIGGGGASANISTVNNATHVTVGNSFYNPVSTVTNIPVDRIGSKTLNFPSAANAQYLFDPSHGYSPRIGTSLNLAFANASSYISNSGINWSFANIAISNATTTLANALSFINFTAYPISTVTINNQGGGIPSAKSLKISAQSLYNTIDGLGTGDLGNLGILGPISIDNGGLGYAVNDKINITGGTGNGAYANVISVNTAGGITNVAYVYSTTNKNPIPLGGLGYTITGLPTLTVSSSGGSGAKLSIVGILGQGAKFDVDTDRVGAITTINVSDYGEDYNAAAYVSFAVQDIYITGVGLNNKPAKGDMIYQGTSATNYIYSAMVDSLAGPLVSDIDPTKDIYVLRTYNYSSSPNTSGVSINSPVWPIKGNNKTYSANITNSYQSTLINLPYYSLLNYANGVITYGDGRAKGNVSFLNGLTIGQGQYLDSSGQPSSFDVLQSQNFNNYTYQITLEKEIAKYRNALLKLLHPTGMKVIGRFAMKSNSSFSISMADSLYTGYPLYDSIKTNNANLLVGSGGDFSQLSSNVITFTNIGVGTNLANVIFSNTTIRFVNNNGEQVYSEVNKVDYANNKVVLRNNVWLTFANVANGSISAGGNQINISNVYTSSFNVFNNGVYLNSNPLADMIHIGDYVKLNNVVKLVTSVDYINNIITVNSAFTYASSGNISLNRSMTANTPNVQLFGPLGQQYESLLTLENGDYLVTEDSYTLSIN